MARIAIVGGGVSGMTAAWLLRGRHDVTLFDANDYLGGHTHTHSLAADGQQWMVDSGFIVFNDKTYPNFRKLLKNLDVKSRPTSMSFSVKSDSDNLEYNGTSINALFAQRFNFFRPKFWRMIKGILAFNNECKQLLAFEPSDETLGSFLARKKFPQELASFYIKPMTAAVWSCGTSTVLEMPIHFLARFFENHGFLNIDDRPQWFTVLGGSKVYAQKIAAALGSSVQLDSRVESVKRQSSGIQLITKNGQRQAFDQVIFACHSDEALATLEDATDDEKRILGDIPYGLNHVVIHKDVNLMPKRRLAWAAWNYNLFSHETDDVAVTYNMNILQGLSCPTQFLVSLNCEKHIDPSLIVKRLTYSHPIYTTRTVAAQARHADISGVNRTHYCGAYWGNGFHEDGVVSALRVVSMIDPEAKL